MEKSLSLLLNANFKSLFPPPPLLPPQDQSHQQEAANALPDGQLRAADQATDETHGDRGCGCKGQGSNFTLWGGNNNNIKKNIKHEVSMDTTCQYPVLKVQRID